MARDPLPIVPSHALGAFTLGASLQEILSSVKADHEEYPAIDVHYSPTEPLAAPVVVTLPSNSLRMRFDGADQRLRLIEVLELRRTRLAYKGSELVKMQEDGYAPSGPSFRRIYQIFGASYPGEYVPPAMGAIIGTYALSWPGVAFTFPLQHSAWSAEKDHVSVLGSSYASAASHMAIFEGNSWSEARKDLFVRTPTGPRSSALVGRPKDALPAEVELAVVHTDSKIELLRGQPAQSFTVVLNQTIPQDLITELGPPDAMHKRDEKAAVSERPTHQRAGSMSQPMSNGRIHTNSQPSSYSSTGTDSFDTDFDSEEIDGDPVERASRETFWCYFNHGIDVLVGPPSVTSTTPNNTDQDSMHRTPLSTSPHLVVTKMIIHGNIPGSYAFNRNRRLRWLLHPSASQHQLTSEHHFDHIQPALLRTFAGVWPECEMGRGKVVNRTWGGSPTDSNFLLADTGEEMIEDGGSEAWLGNTRLYQFPGLVFEVLENGFVGALTVY